MSDTRRPTPTDLTRDRNMARRMQRDKYAEEQNQALRDQYQEALDAGVSRNRLPVVPDHNSPERVSEADRHDMIRRMKMEMPKTAAAPRPGDANLTGPVAPAMSGLPILNPERPEFGSTRNIAGRGMEAFMPDDSREKGGGRWVGTRPNKEPISASQSGLSTPVPNQDMGGGLSRIPVADFTVGPDGKPTTQAGSVIEYDPRRDPNRGTAITYTDKDGAPTGTVGRTIDPRYRVSPENSVGTAKFVPGTAQADATANVAPDPWDALRESHPGIFQPGHRHNAEFWAAWNKQEGAGANAHPTPEQASALASSIFGSNINTSAKARPSNPVTTGYETGATQAGQKIGSMVRDAPSAFTGFVDRYVGDPLRSAIDKTGDAFTGLQSGITGKSPDQIREERRSAPSTTPTVGVGFGGMSVMPPASPSPTPSPSPSFNGFTTPGTSEDMVAKFSKNDEDDQFLKRMGSSSYSDGR